MDPRQVAETVVGRVDWQNEVSGFCRCPGEGLHTSHNGKKDCRVSVDGAPTIFCFHASCVGAVTEANRRLRRELGASPWVLRLPGGQVLRSGDVLQVVADGRRAVLPGERLGTRWNASLPREGSGTRTARAGPNIGRISGQWPSGTGSGRCWGMSRAGRRSSRGAGVGAMRIWRGIGSW